MNIFLLAEGAVDINIIKNLLLVYFGEPEPLINPKPEVDNDGKQIGKDGGWQNVLKYCSSIYIGEALKENDYLIIHIDTDQSDDSRFGVAHVHQDGTKKSSEELYQDIVHKLSGLIQDDIKNEYGHRILYAISIHSIECWLLPLLYTDQTREQTDNCLEVINDILPTIGIRIISKRSKNKPLARESYDAILDRINGKSDIEEIAQHNVGFQKFVESLQAITSNSLQE